MVVERFSQKKKKDRKLSVFKTAFDFELSAKHVGKKHPKYEQ